MASALAKTRGTIKAKTQNVGMTGEKLFGNIRTKVGADGFTQADIEVDRL